MNKQDVISKIKSIEIDNKFQIGESSLVNLKKLFLSKLYNKLFFY